MWMAGENCAGWTKLLSLAQARLEWNDRCSVLNTLS